jgi:hypothetical protein
MLSQHEECAGKCVDLLWAHVSFLIADWEVLGKGEYFLEAK